MSIREIISRVGQAFVRHKAEIDKAERSGTMIFGEEEWKLLRKHTHYDPRDLVRLGLAGIPRSVIETACKANVSPEAIWALWVLNRISDSSEDVARKLNEGDGI